MKTVFLIERSTDVFHTVKSYLKEERLPFVSFQTPDEAAWADEVPALIILFGNNSLQEIRDDIGMVKNKTSFARAPKILVLPLGSSFTDLQCKMFDVQAILSIPVQKLQFQSVIAKFSTGLPAALFVSW